MTFLEWAYVFWVVSIPFVLLFCVQVGCMILDVRRARPEKGFLNLLRVRITPLRAWSATVEFTMEDGSTVLWPRHDLKMTGNALRGALVLLFLSFVFLALDALCS